MKACSPRRALGNPRPRRSRTASGTTAPALVAALLACCVVLAVSAGQDSAAQLRMLRARGFEAAYNLDHDRAVGLFRDALVVAPDDIATHRGIATVQWLEITFARGTISVDEFLGDTRPAAGNLPPPVPERARAFQEHSRRALRMAEAHVAERPGDPEAHYQLGAVVGLLASYTATVDGRIFAAFRSAKRAYDEHERVLALDARRKDAGLIVGSYRYVVSTLWAPTRLVAYLAGFGGGRERGIALVEGAAGYRSDSQIEAKLALVVLYNRERRYAEAARVLSELRARFPRNRLLWLESASTALRAGRAQEAESLLADASTRFAGDARRRAYGEAALWDYTRGLTRLERGDLAGARASLAQALEGEARTWVRARTHLALGKLAGRTGDPARARAEYDAAGRLADSGRDPATGAEARRLRARLPR